MTLIKGQHQGSTNNAELIRSTVFSPLRLNEDLTTSSLCTKTMKLSAETYLIIDPVANLLLQGLRNSSDNQADKIHGFVAPRSDAPPSLRRISDYRAWASGFWHLSRPLEYVTRHITMSTCAHQSESPDRFRELVLPLPWPHLSGAFGSPNNHLHFHWHHFIGFILIVPFKTGTTWVSQEVSERNKYLWCEYKMCQ